MKILIIEDEILIQQSLKKFLEKFKASVTTTASGNEAVTLIKQNSYDRIVCDLMLQDITGFDIIEESKAKYSLKEISKLFVIMTAYPSGQVLSKAKEYNCILLNKPFKNIIEDIKTIIAGKSETIDE
jgi:CheY-like chemotaxis protein